MQQSFVRPLLVFGLIFTFLLHLQPLSASASSQIAADDTNFDAVDDYVAIFMEQYRVPGVALAVVQDDQIVHLRGYGVADPQGHPVTGQTPFIIGSTSKAFTALAVMQLVEAGQIYLDNPARFYLPWFKVGDDGMSAAITVRQLLNHTSGIPEFAGEKTLNVDDSSPDALERQVRGFSGWHLSFSPGSAFEYSNANYQTAALIVQAVSGEPFEAYVQNNIFNPLGMEQSFTSKKNAQENGLASGYQYWFGMPLPAGGTPYPLQHFPSGFYISSAEDLSHEIIAHINGGQYLGESLVSPEGLAVLHQPVLDNYAMGWGSNQGMLWHEGAVADYGSHIIIDTNRKLGVAVLFNINNAIGASHLYALAPGILSILTDREVFPPPSNNEYVTLAVLLGVLLLVELIWLTWSWTRLRGWHREVTKQPRGLSAGLWLGLPIIIELGLTAYLLSLISTPSLPVALLYQPDLTVLSLVICILLVGWGGIRTIAGMKLLRRTT